MAKPEATQMDKIVNLAKRRGFVFPSAEIYGGLGGFWDWGPLGTLLKNNIKRQWWRTFVQLRDDMVGLDGAIITNPKVWEASGHTSLFADLLVESKTSHKRYKLEDLLDEKHKKLMSTAYDQAIAVMNIDKTEKAKEVVGGAMDMIHEYLVNHAKEPGTSNQDWAYPDFFNTMFRTVIGAAESTSDIAYLRPETAQNIFVNFEVVRDSMRRQLPFGVAQIGKAFRNEITPGNFIFRQREFEQMEIEYFVKPGDDDASFDVWVAACYDWFVSLGLNPKHLRKFEQPKKELAHYSKATTDIEYAFPIEKGWGELMGIANRTDYDLKQHGQHAKGDSEAFATPIDDEGKEKKVPYVIEPSWGIDRLVLALLIDAYTVIGGGRSTTTASIKEEEVVLKLHPRLAPYTVAVLPLSKKPELTSIAEKILSTLRRDWMVDYDLAGSIGKRYRRQDEIGTPWCVTVDFDTIEGVKRPKGTVTVRDRDTMTQENVAIQDLSEYFRGKLA